MSRVGSRNKPRMDIKSGRKDLDNPSQQLKSMRADLVEGSMFEDYVKGFKTGDIVSLAVDWEGGNLSFGVNGVMGKSLSFDTR